MNPPLMTRSRSASRIVPADVTSTSASSSPTFSRPLPLIGSCVSIAPKKAGGVSPKCPFHRSTWNDSQPRPSTAIVLSGPPKSIAGSLFPDEFAFGAVAGHDRSPGTHGESSKVFENAGGDAAPLPAVPARTAARTTTAAARERFTIRPLPSLERWARETLVRYRG